LHRRKGFFTRPVTLHKDNQGACAPDCLSFEVLAALSALFMDNLYSSRTQARTARLELGKYPAAGDVPNMPAAFLRLYAGLSYPDHTDAISKGLTERVQGGFLKFFWKKTPGLS
jgi:hypothetical protein